MLRRRVARTALAACCALVASAAAGASAPAAERAFELVTPPGSLAEIETTGGFAAADGDLIVFSSAESLAGAEPNGPFPTYDSFTARRGASGWATEWSTDATDVPGTAGSLTMFSTDDGTRQIMLTENSVDPADTWPHSPDPYLRERQPAGGRAMSWLTPERRLSAGSSYALGATSDLRTVLVETSSPMTVADTDDASDLYLVRDGVATLVSPGTGANSFVGVTKAAGVAVPGTLAADASYVYFNTAEALVPEDADGASDVYRWDSDGVTLISVSRRTLPVSADWDSNMFGASEDGDVVCFTTWTRLVDLDEDDEDDVYCYTRSTDTLEFASDGLDPNTPVQPSQAVALSADGSSIFFSTDAQLTSDDADGGPSLYARRDGTIGYVSRIDVTDLFEAHRVASSIPGQRALKLSPDGATAVFTTAAQAVGEDTDAGLDVYRWTAADGLELVSAGDGPGNATSGATSTTRDTVFTGDAVLGRVMTDDTGSIFFQSTDALVPHDSDGGFIDVYEWRRDRSVRLVSPPGDARYDALYLDNSADGSTVFLVTAEPVLRGDRNSVRDLYAARVGGGFPEVTTVPGCEGDSCQGILTQPPTIAGAGSGRFVGPGNDDETAAPDERQRITRLSARERRAFARRGRTVLRVYVSAPGMVAATATAKIDGRTVRVAQAWRRAMRRGTVRLPLTLTRSARSALRRRGRLRVAIAVDYSQNDELVRQVVVLRG